MLRRLISGIVLVPLVIVPAYLGGDYVLALMLVVAAIAAAEYDGLMRHGGHRTDQLWGAALVLLPLVEAARPQWNVLRLALPLVLMFSLWLPLRSPRLDGALVGWALTVAGALYIGILLAQVIVVRNLNRGWELALMTIINVWVNDTAAYLFGTRFGKHRLAPRISPKKSWEGAFAGGACGTLAGLATGWLLLPDAGMAHLIVLNLLLAVAGIAGDLAESFIKRQVDAKDAGGVIPGHGGLLDRIDSLMFAFPVTALYAVAVLNMR